MRNRVSQKLEPADGPRSDGSTEEEYLTMAARRRSEPRPRSGMPAVSELGGGWGFITAWGRCRTELGRLKGNVGANLLQCARSGRRTSSPRIPREPAPRTFRRRGSHYAHRDRGRLSLQLPAPERGLQRL